MDRNVEDGSFRVDANLNIQHNEQKFHPVEIKKIMGFRFLRQALEFLYARQISKVRKGELIVAETRMFCQKSGQTISMREKEHSSYNFIPEHEIIPILVTENMIKTAIDENLQYSSLFDGNIQEKFMFKLKNSSNSMDLFINLMKENPTLNRNNCINWICNDVLRLCNKNISHSTQKHIFSTMQFAKQLSQIIENVQQEVISKYTGLYLLEQIILNESKTIAIQNNFDIMTMIHKKKLFLVKDKSSVAVAVENFQAQFPGKSCADFIKHYKGKYCSQQVVEHFSSRQRAKNNSNN